MTDRAPQPQDKFIVRLPDGMRDRIKAAAEANNRSMNAEIVATLEEKYPQPSPSNYVELLNVVMDILIGSGLTKRTPADKENLIQRLQVLPDGLREETAKEFVDTLVGGIQAQVDEFRKLKPEQD